MPSPHLDLIRKSRPAPKPPKKATSTPSAFGTLDAHEKQAFTALGTEAGLSTAQIQTAEANYAASGDDGATAIAAAVDGVINPQTASSLPSWAIYAAIGIAVLVVILLLLRRRK
jgi:hypothetical protein